MWDRNRVGTELSYRPASQCGLDRRHDKTDLCTLAANFHIQMEACVEIVTYFGNPGCAPSVHIFGRVLTKNMQYPVDLLYVHIPKIYTGRRILLVPAGIIICLLA
jgi:hypothetical protein